MRKLFLLLTCLFLLAVNGLCQSEKDLDKNQKTPSKIGVDELVAKHLASIGKAEDIAAAKTRVLVGSGLLASKTGPSSLLLDGTAQLASSGDNLLFAIIFASASYPYEKAAFDGNDTSVGVPAGRKTQLAEFLRSQSSILKDGLFTGTLSTAWPLLDQKSKLKIKLEYGGTGKVEGQQCYKLKYSSKSTGELKVVLYFNAETFRHVRTEYEFSIAQRMGASSTDRSQDSVEYYKLTEDFSEFTQAGKLILPFVYKINVTNQGQVVSPKFSGSLDWTVKIKEVYYNEALTSGNFKVS